MKGQFYAVVYTHPDGRKEDRYTRPIRDLELAKRVRIHNRQSRAHGFKSNYTIERRDG